MSRASEARNECSIAYLQPCVGERMCSRGTVRRDNVRLLLATTHQVHKAEHGVAHGQHLVLEEGLLNSV